LAARTDLDSVGARKLLIGLLVVFALTGCASSEETSDAALVALLPNKLAGVPLQKESFSGRDWLKSRPEFSSPYFLPEFRADPQRFLERLDKGPRDLTVAWALAPEGIQVIAYRVRGAKASALVAAYLAVTSRHVRARTIDVVGRNVTMIRAELPQRGFLYAYGDVLYAANSYHVDGRELDELIAKLPGERSPRSLEQLLPISLRGTRLTRETFRGDVWLRAAPEEAFQPEVKVDLRRFLAELHLPSSALTVAWGIAPDGPKVVAYQITGVASDRLLSAFIRAVGGVRTTDRSMAGRRVTIARTAVPGRLGYLYVRGDTVFVAGSNHLAPGEVGELLSKLP